MTKFEIFKEKLKICWKLWRANQYFFASYRGDMSVACQLLGKKNISCYNSEPTYPIFIETCEKMCRKLVDKSNEKWELVGVQIESYDDLFWLLNHGVYCYVSSEDEFKDDEKRMCIKGNGETGHIELWESKHDGKMLAEYSCGDEMRDKLWEPDSAAGKVFYYMHYEEKNKDDEKV